jgi:hypothetical protein
MVRKTEENKKFLLFFAFLSRKIMSEFFVARPEANPTTSKFTNTTPALH